MTFFVFASAAAMTGIIASEFLDWSPVGFRHSVVVVVIVVAIRTVYMRFRCFDFFGAGHSYSGQINNADFNTAIARKLKASIR